MQIWKIPTTESGSQPFVWNFFKVSKLNDEKMFSSNFFFSTNYLQNWDYDGNNADNHCQGYSKFASKKFKIVFQTITQNAIVMLLLCKRKKKKCNKLNYPTILIFCTHIQQFHVSNNIYNNITINTFYVYIFIYTQTIWFRAKIGLAGF